MDTTKIDGGGVIVWLVVAVLLAIAIVVVALMFRAAPVGLFSVLLVWLAVNGIVFLLLVGGYGLARELGWWHGA